MDNNVTAWRIHVPIRRVDAGGHGSGSGSGGCVLVTVLEVLSGLGGFPWILLPTPCPRRSSWHGMAWHGMDGMAWRHGGMAETPAVQPGPFGRHPPNSALARV
jgi:hypothetical protein